MNDDQPDEVLPRFRIHGPDADGLVWIHASHHGDNWCHNLGPVEAVAEAWSQWLGSIDQDERS